MITPTKTPPRFEILKFMFEKLIVAEDVLKNNQAKFDFPNQQAINHNKECCNLVYTHKTVVEEIIKKYLETKE